MVARKDAGNTTLARKGVVDECDQSRLNLFDIQIQLSTSSTFSLAFLGTAAHWLVARFGAISGGWVLVACNSFQMFAVREFLLDHLLTLEESQVSEQVAVHGEGSH